MTFTVQPSHSSGTAAERPSGTITPRADPATSASAATPDFAVLKQRQQATWATGDYAVIGTTLQIVGERLCEAVDLRAGERVLDVAAGNGNASLAAAQGRQIACSLGYAGAPPRAVRGP